LIERNNNIKTLIIAQEKILGDNFKNRFELC